MTKPVMNPDVSRKVRHRLPRESTYMHGDATTTNECGATRIEVVRRNG
jgi:hypothetical protein